LNIDIRNVPRRRIVNVDESGVDGKNLRHERVIYAKDTEAYAIMNTFRGHITIVLTIFGDNTAGPIVWIKQGGEPTAESLEVWLKGANPLDIMFGSSKSRIIVML